MSDDPQRRLLDVPLTVTVVLGGCVLPMRAVLGLGTGAVVALDRAAGAAVDLLVNDRVVARGDLIAVDDRYGVRITELCDG